MRNYFALPSLYIGLLSLALPVGVPAQSTTSLRGTVTDPSGSAIPDAVLTLTNAGTGFKRQVLTSADGVYQFLQTPPGTYQIAAAKPGFNPLGPMSIRSLEDLNYTVNTAAADPYTLPFGISLRAAFSVDDISATATPGEWERPLPRAPRALPTIGR